VARGVRLIGGTFMHPAAFGFPARPCSLHHAASNQHRKICGGVRCVMGTPGALTFRSRRDGRAVAAGVAGVIVDDRGIAGRHAMEPADTAKNKSVKVRQITSACSRWP
jgi:hypothetical protein